MFYLQHSLGIDCRGSEINLALIGKGVKGSEVIATRTIPFQESDENPEMAVAFVADRIRDFLKENNSKPDFIILGLPRGEILLRGLTIPAVPESEVRGLLYHQLDRHIPYKPEEVAFDWLDVSNGEGRGRQILLAAIIRERAFRYHSYIVRADQIPDAFSISALASLNCLKETGELREKEVILLIDIEESGTDLTLCRGDQVIFNRSTPALKASSLDPEEGSPDMARDLSRQVALVTAAARLGEPDEAIDRISLLGESVGEKFQEQVFEVLQVPATTYSPDSIFAAEPREEGGPRTRYAQAIGLGLASSKSAPVRLNILPDELKGKKQRYGLIGAVSLAAAIIILAFLLALTGIYRDYSDLKSVRLMLKENQPKVLAINDITANTADMKTYLDALKEVVSNYPLRSEIWLDLTNRIPLDIWLFTMRVSGSELYIKGKGKDPERLISILEESPFFEDVKFAGAVTKRGFEIKANITAGTSSGLEEIELADQETAEEAEISGTPGAEESDAAEEQGTPKEGKADGEEPDKKADSEKKPAFDKASDKDKTGDLPTIGMDQTGLFRGAGNSVPLMKRKDLSKAKSAKGANAQKLMGGKSRTLGKTSLKRDGEKKKAPKINAAGSKKKRLHDKKTPKPSSEKENESSKEEG